MQRDIYMYKRIFLSFLHYLNPYRCRVEYGKIKWHGEIVRSGTAADRSIIQLNATAYRESHGDIADYAAALRKLGALFTEKNPLASLP